MGRRLLTNSDKRIDATHIYLSPGGDESRFRREQLRDVERGTFCKRLDLLAAGEATRKHSGAGLRRKRRQEGKLRDAPGGGVELCAVAEGAGHAAAAGVRRAHLATGRAQHREIGLRAPERLLMAMRVHHDLLSRGDLYRRASRRQEFRQRNRTRAQPRRARIVGKELRELVAKDREASRLEHDERHAGFKLRRESLQDAPEGLLCL